jgi:hypothetical protein
MDAFRQYPSDGRGSAHALRSYDELPNVAFIIPNLLNDMHSASRERGDAWLRARVNPLVTWAKAHDSLIIVAWNESSSALSNRIPTIFVGPMVKPGLYAEPVNLSRCGIQKSMEMPQSRLN